MKALAALGETSEAIHDAELCRGSGTHDADVDGVCEEILLKSGQVEEAYQP